VELFDYTECDEEIVLLMEYCNDANYFERKIEEVSSRGIIALKRLRHQFTNVLLSLWGAN
jgi:hypothetical protein